MDFSTLALNLWGVFLAVCLVGFTVLAVKLLLAKSGEEDRG